VDRIGGDRADNLEKTIAQPLVSTSLAASSSLECVGADTIIKISG
jgi:hypothetical protein